MRRWKLRSEFLEEEFAQGHQHRDTDGLADHFHNPLDPSTTDHCHLPWSLGEAGARVLYDRLPYAISFYDIAPKLFNEAGDNLMYWIGDDKPTLTEWRFLRRGQLLEAIGVYENGKDEFQVGFYWIGRQLKPVRMMEKWDNQVENLVCTSEATEFERRMNPYAMEQTDPDFDDSPQLSLHVMVGADDYATRQAMESVSNIGYLRERAFSFWVAENPCRKICESGRVWPGGDTIVDRIEYVPVGEPERVAPPSEQDDRDKSPFPKSLSSVLPYRIFSLAEEHAAIRQEDAEDILRKESREVEPALESLVEDNILVKLEDEYYLTDPAMNYVAVRDRISVSSVRDRLLSYVGENNHRRHHELEHNRGMWRIVRAMHRCGIEVYGGWRGVRHFQGVTQIQTDGLLYANGPWGKTRYFLEHERTATTPEKVTEKLRTYKKALGLGIRLRAIWITETRGAATQFLQRARNLDVMVATLDELEAGPIAGPATIWRSTASGNVELKAYNAQ